MPFYNFWRLSLCKNLGPLSKLLKRSSVEHSLLGILGRFSQRGAGICGSFSGIFAVTIEDHHGPFLGVPEECFPV